MTFKIRMLGNTGQQVTLRGLGGEGVLRNEDAVLLQINGLPTRT